MAFQIRFEDKATAHLGELTARERALILDEIERQLLNQPDVPARHRRQLRSKPLAKWQLSVDYFRVFYDVDEPRNEVVILAIGRERRKRLFIGGKAFKI